MTVMEKGQANIMPTISAMWDIKSLIERFASIDIAYKSTVHGVLEYHSNCPFCPGSKDSFIMRPETGEWNHCTRADGCDRHGDCIDFLISELVNMTRPEACDFLGIEQNADFVPSECVQSAPSGKEAPPNKEWQETGKLLVERAAKYLYSPAGKEMLDYLHARGLGDEIIKKKKLGYVPLQKNGNFYEDSLENWGLDGTCGKDKVRVPDCILIPWFEGSTLWRLAVKRPNPPKGQNRYGQVLGSGEGLFNVSSVQYDFPAMIVEGELCAMSVEQEAGDLVACVATGSTTRGRLNKWVAEMRLVLPTGFVLQSFDEDDSGDEGADFWMQHLEKCMRWSPMIAKDPNDILRQKFFEGYTGYSLREWVLAGCQSAFQEFFPNKLVTAGKSFSPDEEKAVIDALENNLREIHTRPFAPDSSPTHLARGRVFNIDLSRTKWHGPEVDMKALSIREYVKSHLALGMCLNSKCPCGM